MRRGRDCGCAPLHEENPTPTHITIGLALAAIGLALTAYQIFRTPPAAAQAGPLPPVTGNCSRFRGATNLSKAAVARAYQILNSKPMGAVVIEPWDGKLLRFVVETHPPDAGISVPHKGVTVFSCID